MFARTTRFAASAGLLALVLGGCSDATAPTPIAPSAPTAAAASVYRFVIEADGISRVDLGDVVTDCLGEPIEVHYHSQFRVMLQQTGNQERSMSSLHMNDMGSWALGLTTGTVYRVVGTSIDQDTGTPAAYDNGAATFTSAGHQQYVGPGGTTFTVRTSYGLTLTPDGTLKAERGTSIIECR